MVRFPQSKRQKNDAADAETRTAAHVLRLAGPPYVQIEARQDAAIVISKRGRLVTGLHGVPPRSWMSSRSMMSRM